MHFSRYAILVAIFTATLFAAGCSSNSSRVVCPLSSNGSNCTCGPCPISPGPEFLFATSGSSGGQILSFPIDHNSGALGMPSAIAGPATASGIVAAENQFLYASDMQGGVIDAYSIDQTTGALSAVSGSPFNASGTQPVFPQSLVAGSALYATSVSGVAAFDIGSNGALTSVTGSPFGSLINGEAALGQSDTTPTNYFLFASGFIDGTISVFQIPDPTTGALTPVAGNFSTGSLSGPGSVAFDGVSSTPFLYVALTNPSKIAAFSVDPSTGVLTALSGSPFDGGMTPAFLTLNSAENVLYALNLGGGNVSAYSIGSDGVLTEISGSPYTVGTQPGGMTITGDGYLYVSLPASNSIVGFSIGSTGGLTPLGGSPFTASGAELLTTVQVPPP